MMIAVLTSKTYQSSTIMSRPSNNVQSNCFLSIKRLISPFYYNFLRTKLSVKNCLEFCQRMLRMKYCNHGNSRQVFRSASISRNMPLLMVICLVLNVANTW